MAVVNLQYESLTLQEGILFTGERRRINIQIVFRIQVTLKRKFPMNTI